ncbi:Aste57867_17967 [Aphanomyces stellatus]|uniref:Aste57867_17967 protein n=1 Tax=Aphanomyces stellatus TaxID=120398 RepID=A0A485L940_9STRA|nr:hypothetical protein As57867_017905 [Aphanomyces stellatus]VFT94707.1 Aste57867_17967 [Aphanomyces stellatus]
MVSIRASLASFVFVFAAIDAKNVYRRPPPSNNWTEKTQRAVDFVRAQHAISGSPGWALAIYGNPTSVVTPDTMFQIGSVTKSLVAVGIAKLVDDGLVAWHDPIKQHMPWFELTDKYAEKYTTVHDILAMNTVFGEADTDNQLSLGVFKSEREAVEMLKYFETSRSFREGYAYANVNFVIAGQLIASVTNQTWGDYLRDHIFLPLGMTNTHGKAADVPSLAARSFGHFVCGGNLAGPYDVNFANISALPHFGDASGTAISSIHDMAIFAQFLLNKGAPLFKSPQAISDMVTGHEIQTWFSGDFGATWGYHFYPQGGDALAAGYGIDVVGQALYPGVDYYDKNGDTAAHQTRTGFVPSQDLAVVLINNGHVNDLQSNYQRLSNVRTYIIGLLLDLPEAELLETWEASVRVSDAMGSQPCEPHIYQGTPYKGTFTLLEPEKDWLVGNYTSIKSPKFNGHLSIYQAGGALHLRYGWFDGALVAQTNDTFVWDIMFASITFTVGVKKTADGAPVVGFVMGGPGNEFDESFVFTKVASL